MEDTWLYRILAIGNIGIGNILTMAKLNTIEHWQHKAEKKLVMKRDENQNVEYKESWHDKYFEWICGYANAKGRPIKRMERSLRCCNLWSRCLT